MNSIIFDHNQQDCSKNIARNICLYNKLSIGYLVSKNKGRYKSFHQYVKDFIAEIVEIPSILPSKVGKWNDKIWIIIDTSIILLLTMMSLEVERIYLEYFTDLEWNLYF